MEQATLLHAKSQLVGRHDLRDLPTPSPTSTHFPISHARVVEALAETLAFRHFSIVSEEYAVSHDGMRFFGALTLDVEDSGVRLAIGLRNSHDKSFSLALTVGRRVLVCDNLALSGDYAPMLRKHTKKAEIEPMMSIAVDQMQRNFEPMKRQIAFYRGSDLSDQRAKLIIYDAFLGGAADLPKHLAAVVHDHYFNPRYEEFAPRTLWSLENAFTSAVKELDPVSRLKTTGRMAPFLSSLGSAGWLADGVTRECRSLAAVQTAEMEAAP